MIAYGFEFTRVFAKEWNTGVSFRLSEKPCGLKDIARAGQIGEISGLRTYPNNPALLRRHGVGVRGRSVSLNKPRYSPRPNTAGHSPPHHLATAEVIRIGSNTHPQQFPSLIVGHAALCRNLPHRPPLLLEPLLRDLVPSPQLLGEERDAVLFQQPAVLRQRRVVDAFLAMLLAPAHVLLP